MMHGSLAAASLSIPPDSSDLSQIPHQIHPLDREKTLESNWKIAQLHYCADMAIDI